jgi:hypothetical protein
MNRLFVLLLCATLTLSATAAPKKDATPAPAGTPKPVPAPDFTGRYERSGGTSIFILHVTQRGANADVEFSASKADGSGAAPDGNGRGALNEKNELVFTFEDSLGNKGTGTLKKTGNSYSLDMKAENVVAASAVKLYGVIPLKRTVDRAE